MSRGHGRVIASTVAGRGRVMTRLEKAHLIDEVFDHVGVDLLQGRKQANVRGWSKGESK
jgi:hypothetical protein